MFDFEEITDNVKESFRKPNKTTFFIIGGFIVLVLVLWQKRQPTKSVVPAEETITEIEDYPKINPSVLDEQFSNVSNQIYAQVGNDLQAWSTDIFYKNKEYADQVKEVISSELQTMKNEQQNFITEWSKLKETANPTTPVINTNGTLTTGTFQNEEQAKKIKAELENSYNAQEVSISYENGLYRVNSKFQDTDRAKKVFDRMKERNLIGVGYVK